MFFVSEKLGNTYEFLQLLLPVLLLIVAIWASNKVYEPTNPDPPLKMSLSPYKRIVTPYASTDEVHIISLYPDEDAKMWPL